MSKRKRKDVDHELLPLDPDEDFFTIRSREIGLNARGQGVEQPVSPQKGSRAWMSKQSWEPEDRQDIFLDPTGEWYDETVEGGVFDVREWEAPKASLKKKKHTIRALRPHQYWRIHSQQEFLDELLRHDGWGDARGQEACWDCLSRSEAKPGRAHYRCLDCFLQDLVCRKCCVRRHRLNPFHRVERWAKGLFEEVSLKSLGLSIQLNHQTMFCTNPVACHKDFRILHWNGIHEVNLNFCGCADTIPHHLQLLRRGLYPATQSSGRITTVATFRYLEHLHLLTLTTKASTYDLMRALSKATDNTGLKKPAWRYRALMRMVVQWRHLKSLKRAGRGHDPSGVAGTKEGELAVLCPSCPRPGINLPEGWELDKSKEDLYTLRLTMDANFRLKEQVVSSHSRDPGLIDGGGYFVKRIPYESYVLSRASDADISTCVGFMAIAKAATKFSKGLRYTGVGAVSCARGEMLLPNGMGNLQKGERYANMDYPFASTLQHFSGVRVLVIGYDIACQWFVNLRTRMRDHWPAELKLDENLKCVPVIGKFHEPAHRTKNHEQFSCNLIRGGGHTEHEGQERIWGVHNSLGNATKTMGPGTRVDTLEAHFGFHNWQKYIGMGRSIWARYGDAVKERNRQREAHRGLTESLPKELTEQWEKLCVAWEIAPFPKEDVDNPFEVHEEFLTEAQVEKELAIEDEMRARQQVQFRHRTTAGKFISLGLELEDAQTKLRAEVAEFKASSQTTRRSTAIIERRSILRRSIRSFEELRAIYMPGLLQYLTDRDEQVNHGEEIDPEECRLWLPSAIDRLHRAIVCVDEVETIEERLRQARCFDALDGIRHTLRVKARMILFKNANVRGQRSSGKSREVIDRVHNRAKSFVDKYHRNREALLLLRGEGDWVQVLRELRNDDVRSYTDPAIVKKGAGRRGTDEEEPGHEGEPVDEVVTGEEEGELNLLVGERDREAHGTGETRRLQSWIWTTSAINLRDGADENNDEILRSEWCRSRARALRCTEEVALLREEMRRTVEFLDWRVRWWEERKALRGVSDSRLKEGLEAYSMKQVRVQRGLRESFMSTWSGSLVKEGEEEDSEETAVRNMMWDGRVAKGQDDDEEDEEDEGEGDDEGDVAMPDREVEEGEEEEDLGWV